MDKLPYDETQGGCGCDGGEDNEAIQGGGMYRDMLAAFESQWGHPQNLGRATIAFFVIFLIVMIVVVFTDKGSDMSFKYVASMLIVGSFLLMVFYDYKENSYSYAD